MREERQALVHRFGIAAKYAAAVAMIALGSALSHAQPSAPSSALLAAAETARLTVAGRVSDVTRLDRSGYAATIVVDRVLAGKAQAGESLRIGWEELSERPPRFADRQRIVVALDDLPQASLWRQRFPTGGLVVASRADASLVEPSAIDLELLAAYLQPSAKSSATARGTALSHIAASGSPVLAEAAVARLTSLSNPAAALDGTAVAALMRTASDSNKPLPLRRGIIALTGRARMSAAASGLEALARPGAPLESEALTALGEIRGGLPDTQVERLLERSQPDVRAVGARFASDSLAERRLPLLVRTDPAPTVRAAAAATLAVTRTLWGVDGAVPALSDSDPSVRSAAAQALGGLGPPVVPTLEKMARTRPEAARSAITALTLAGPQGIAVVRRMADDHADERLRDFARLALGKGPPAH